MSQAQSRSTGLHLINLTKKPIVRHGQSVFLGWCLYCHSERSDSAVEESRAQRDPSTTLRMTNRACGCRAGACSRRLYGQASRLSVVASWVKSEVWMVIQVKFWNIQSEVFPAEKLWNNSTTAQSANSLFKE